jgi:UDP-N-acetylglucosamine 2-epimerase (non-hydrolysing)
MNSPGRGVLGRHLAEMPVSIIKRIYFRMNVTLIAGARPNFMKIAPVIHAIKRLQASGVRRQEEGKVINYRLVHTGQHYDRNMSETFFKELNIPEPDINLNCGGGSQAEQTAAIMIAFEKDLLEHPADLVIVVGDVTSTMACSIVAKKLNTKVAHIEAGIRSYDLTMPEEINRMVTDCLADYFFTTTELAGINLRKNGVPDDKIFFTGNVMIDTLLANRHRFRKPEIWDKAGLTKGNYLVITLHRPNNVDNPSHLKLLLEAIISASHNIPIIFPVHPRTSKIIADIDMNDSPPLPFTPSPFQSIKNLYFTEPLGYLEFNYLVENAKGVITDSGGITEETTVFGIPCITLRDNTERPETITVGTNELIGTDPAAIRPAMEKLFSGNWKKGGIPELWDGCASERIVAKLIELEEEILKK